MQNSNNAFGGSEPLGSTSQQFQMNNFMQMNPPQIPSLPQMPGQQMFQNFTSNNPNMASLGYLKALVSVGKDFFASIEMLIDEQTKLQNQQNIFMQTQMQHQNQLQQIMQQSLLGQQPQQIPNIIPQQNNTITPTPKNISISNQNDFNEKPPQISKNNVVNRRSSQNSQPQRINPPQKSAPVISNIIQNDSSVSSENKLGTPSSFLIFFYENRIFIKKQFKGLSNNQIAKKAGELWKQFDDSQKDVYRQISDRLRTNPIPGVSPKNFDGVQEYKRQMGLPTVDNPEIMKEFKEDNENTVVEVIPEEPKKVTYIKQQTINSNNIEETQKQIVNKEKVDEVQFENYDNQIDKSPPMVEDAKCASQSFASQSVTDQYPNEQEQEQVNNNNVGGGLAQVYLDKADHEIQSKIQNELQAEQQQEPPEEIQKADEQYSTENMGDINLPILQQE